MQTGKNNVIILPENISAAMGYNNPDCAENEVIMKNKAALRFVSEACIYYTAICIFTILLNVIITGSFDSDAINCLQFLMFLPFTLCLSLANLLYRHFAASRPKRYLLHFLACECGFLLGIYMPYAITVKPSATNSFIIISLALLLYLLGALIHAVATSGRDKRAQEEKPYVSQFKNK